MKVLTVRIDDELHEKIRKESFETGKSMNEIVIELIKKHYNKGDK